ncbi:hypothetical protein P7K49_030832, partial [Saguinus oedipus]
GRPGGLVAMAPEMPEPPPQGPRVERRVGAEEGGRCVSARQGGRAGRDPQAQPLIEGRRATEQPQSQRAAAWPRACATAPSRRGWGDLRVRVKMGNW